MKIMLFDQGNPVAWQLAAKAVRVFGAPSEGKSEIVIARALGKAHGTALETLQKAVEEMQPEVLLIGATALGEEVAPALGIRLGTGVAAHCIDLHLNEKGEPVFMIPAFGGRVIGEIMIPDAAPGKPAIATVKPDLFPDEEGICLDRAKEMGFQIIELESAEQQQGFRLAGTEPRQRIGVDLGKAELILCGGFGLGSQENWERLQRIADALGGAAGCTRPVVDAGWGADESRMIGTSGRTVKPKVYVGFGISGAAHHLCGIKDADMIISINKDKQAEIFSASDYKGVFDAEKVLDALEKEIGI